MTAPTAILRFNETEISTTDPVTVQTLWRFLSHCVTPAEYAAVDGPNHLGAGASADTPTSTRRGRMRCTAYAKQRRELNSAPASVPI